MVTKMDGPVERLLQQDREKSELVHTLGIALTEFEYGVHGYREAWKRARAAGWAKTDLVRAGFLDPARLPRTREAVRSSSDPSDDDD